MEEHAIVEVQHVTKVFGESAAQPASASSRTDSTPATFAAVDDVSLTIRRGEFFSLLGPSGCGKTTLLRMIAGLEMPTAGTLRISGEDMTHVPAHRRPVHMVFQQYALFPHLTVAQNVAFGLRYKGIPRSQYAEKVDAALDLVRLSGLHRRRPDQLSGGQRQRVALARALVLEPQVLLLDEPLGALDQKLRKEMQVELRNMQRKLGITFVFVTHDQEEALTMSDRVAVMNRGKVEQLGPAAEVFERPSTEFVAHFMGAANFFQAPATSGPPARFVIRPEKLHLRTNPPEGANWQCLRAKVEERVYQGINTMWVVNAAESRYTIYEQNVSPIHSTGPDVGDDVFVCWDPQHAVVIDAQGVGRND